MVGTVGPSKSSRNWAEQTDDDSQDACAEPGSSPHGISILKEIFPDHGSREDSLAKPSPSRSDKSFSQLSPSRNDKSFSQSLLSVPSPLRTSTVPIQGVTSTVPLAGPPVPPPPAPVRQNPRDSNRMTPPMQSQMAPPPPPMQPSYRERLRAGGREALQRTYNESGFVPPAVKQNGYGHQQQASCGHDMYRTQADRSPTTSPLSRASTVDSQSAWNMNVESQQHGCGFFQHPDSQSPQFASSVPYTPNVDSHPAWSISRSVHSDDWSANTENYQMSSPFFPSQQMQMMPPSHEMGQLSQLPCQLEKSPPLLQTLQPQMQQQMPLHMLPQTQAEWKHNPTQQFFPEDLSPMAQMQVQRQQTSLPQMQFAMPPRGDASASDFDRCMAIVMGDASRSPCDRTMMAAQLQAAADCQCYED